ncbi:hypothetical protein Q8W71_04285 [Methylobacterium sp. NEAU 140]|uniref:hypothetical protein n=1 Tax=Methylobacterium sp. NEAU 140 TaxID=3064945 RepID=UPI002736D902|nr:hypothetical protein [Methylobacterium sp. NEAU 140]MDP4021835.1 hypothetical protein [Methylobacterium sp. NEAU 140]
MTDQEITTIVSDLLRNRIPDAGFEGAEAISARDSDGDPVIRVIARYQRRPRIKPDPLLNSVHAIREKLLTLGEDRFILLKNDVLEERETDEDFD